MCLEKRAMLIREWMATTEMIAGRNEGAYCKILIDMRNNIEKQLPADLVTALKAFFV